MLFVDIVRALLDILGSLLVGLLLLRAWALPSECRPIRSLTLPAR
jgi:hypothetical protein